MPNNLKPLVVKHNIKDKRYWVDTNGNVYWRSKDGKYKKMKPFTSRDGYTEYVLTRKDGTKQHIQAQIIVLSTYKGTHPDKTQVNHKNGKRNDNRLSNLEWVTPSENIKHSFKTLNKVVWNSPKRQQK